MCVRLWQVIGRQTSTRTRGDYALLVVMLLSVSLPLLLLLLSFLACIFNPGQSSKNALNVQYYMYDVVRSVYSWRTARVIVTLEVATLFVTLSQGV